MGVHLQRNGATSARRTVDDRHSEDGDSAETREKVLGVVERGKKRTKSSFEEGQRDSSDVRRYVSDKFKQDPVASQHQHRVRTVVTIRRELTNLQREVDRTKKTKARKTEDEQAEDEEDEEDKEESR